MVTINKEDIVPIVQEEGIIGGEEGKLDVKEVSLIFYSEIFHSQYH